MLSNGQPRDLNIDAEPVLRIVQLAEPHIDRTADMLAHAFTSDPAYAYLFPSAGTRAAGLRDFFDRNLRTHLPMRCTFVGVDASERPIATVTLRPPGMKISLWTVLRRGLLPFTLSRGRAAVRRLFWLKDTYDALEADAADRTPHAYVHMMAVAPEHQGRGLGSRMLAHVLAGSSARQTAPLTVLTTHLERNVVFYQRHGFELLSRRMLHPPDSDAYIVWSMRTRRAGSQA